MSKEKLKETAPDAAEQCKDLMEETTRQKVEDVMGTNILSPLAAADKKTLRKALNDEKRISNFEAIALVIIAFAKISKCMPDKWRNFFLDVEDNIDSTDITDQKKLGDEAKKYLQQAEKFVKRGRDAIVSAAYSVIGSQEFRGAEVDGGNLACAQVASFILMKAGILKRQYLGVGLVMDALKRQGWKEKKGTPKPGDVVVWNRTTKRSTDGNVALGHRHIGIVVSPNRTISNSSSLKTPREHALGTNENDGYWNKRGILMILTPPEEKFTG